MRFNFPKISRPDQNLDSQAGVTLLLTVLIVSVMVLISMTVSVLVMQELRAARSSVLTEPAIIGAEIAGEQGLFQYKQLGNIPNLCSSNQNTSTLSQSCSSSNLRISKSVEYGPALITLEPGTVRDFYIYDPLLPNSNLEMTQNGTAIYTHLVVEHVSGLTGSGFEVDIQSLDGQDGGHAEIFPKDSETFSVFPIFGAADKRVKVTITAGTERATIRLSTLGIYEGLPGYPVIRAEACRAPQNLSNCSATGLEIYRRRLDITVPDSQL